jgi:hypothetical protein
MIYLPLDPANPEIGRGDPLERVAATGFVQPAQAASTTVIGVSPVYVAANTGGNIPLYDAIDMTFYIQFDDGTLIDESGYSFEYEFLVGAPDPVTQQSTYMIAGATQANNPALPVKIVRKKPANPGDDNDFGDFAVVEMKINNQLFKSAGTQG